ncbi:Glutaredoxin family protein [Euphorbia peplus]|nr:Glutaredoxin family protein [Euphorbia peplus]
MGCASSKQKRCRHCHTPYSPVPRSYSMHVIHPPQDKDDSCHVVALTSTTLGSLNIKNNINAALDIVAAIGNDNDDDDADDSDFESRNHKEFKNKEDEFSVGLIEAKSWSNMIQEKIPKIIPRTPVRTPPGEPETINTWELMEGLEEDVEGCLNSPLPHRFRSFSFDITNDPNRVSDSPKLLNHHHHHHIKPIWVQLAEEEEEEEEIQNPNSTSQEFDPNVISTFRKSLNQLSPDHPFYIKPSSSDEDDKPDDSKSRKQDKAIIYSTSLRGVRKTYEDCCHVRVILKGLGLRVDERDVSMHSGFKEELKQLLGHELISGTGGLGLPRVFVGTKYIGGAEEIKRMHEQGQLDMVFDGCERAEEHGGGVPGACEACGDVRFIPCETCSGSCKIYYEEDNDDDDNEDEENEEENNEYGFQRCPDCNENGLIRCPICCC